ncbi:uncharacterized protein LOC123505578 isoform X2 [Portunus trituberculatus]|uniref:uncharacterized protein LOC123505578 isoform X2 n=1 Tax=Portunus trituberculatus TaxID=210409 RepID=UPI001E1D11D6|nr:uncharacterized protein LOC123505578 isoform X2 [Portunus trituberculatus]
MAQQRNDQLANLYFNPPINGYEQLVIFLMDVVRQNWKNLEEVELVEDEWRKKLIKAGALPHRPNEKYFRLRHIVDKTCFGVKYDRKINSHSAFTIYTPLKCSSPNFSVLSHIRCIILEQVPELLEARSKGVEYEAEFLQTELVRELQKRAFHVPDCLLRYTKHIQELIQQGNGKLIRDFIDGLYKKPCLPKTAAEANKKLRLFILYKMLTSREHSGIDVPDEIFPEHEEDELVNKENIMICQFSKVMKPKRINNYFLNVVLKLGNRDYTFKTCRLKVSLPSHSDLETGGK